MQLFLDAQARGEPIELLLLDWKMPGMNGLDTARAISEACARGEGSRPPTIIMVTAFGRGELLKAADEFAVDAILTKPVTPSGLFETLVRLQHGHTEQGSAAAETFSETRSVLSAIRGAHVLLVEDNELNQQVAQEFLAKGGLRVTVANNGRDALEWVRRTAFDAILMDVHMPVMDGLEATRRIRALPVGGGLPIIAMTAAAMPDDRQASADAGMNDHIAKPVDPRELADTLIRWVTPGGGNVPDVEIMPASGAEHDTRRQVEQLERALPGVSVRVGVARMGGSLGLYRRLLRAFAERNRDLTARLKLLKETGDREGIYLEAHNLKGEAGNVGLDAVRVLADQLAHEIKIGQDSRQSDLIIALSIECGAAIALVDRLPEYAPPAAADSDAEPTGELPAPDVARMMPLFGELATRLQTKNFDARRLSVELRDRLRGSGPAAHEFAAIAVAVEQLHYDDALTLLEAFLERHDWRPL